LTGGINAEQLERYMASSHNPSGLGVGGVGNVDPSGQIAMSIAINQQQLFAINAHLYKMQCMSGAQLNITPGNQGLFHLVVSGSEAQVEAAKSLVSSVIGTASL
jgi:CUG-BP- and ETR3-like factor